MGTADSGSTGDSAGRVTPGYVSTVSVGQDLDDEHRDVLEAYRQAHGLPWIGLTPTAVMVNEAVDWWNQRQTGADDG